MKRFFVKTLAMLLVCIFVLSGINFSIFASSGSGDLGDTLAAMNVAVSGQIKMLFYFTDVDGVDYYEVKVGENDESPRIVRKANMPTDVKGGKTRYLLEVPLAAAQQTEDIIITPYNDEGVSGRTRTRRVTDYADRIVELDKAADDDTYRSLVKALKSMLNYGAMAQLAFSYNTAELANKGLYYGATNPVNNLPVDALYNVKGTDYKATDVSKLHIDMASAYLENVVSIKCYIDYYGDYSNLHATVEGEDDIVYPETYKDENGAEQTRYYVKVNNIPATKFDYQYTIVVTDGADMVTLKYSVLNFVQGMIEKNADAEDVNAARSMYQFYVWMSEYVGKNAAISADICKHERSYVEPETLHELCSDCDKDITPKGLVQNAADLANGVNAYFGTVAGDGSVVTDKLRQNYVVTNANMAFHSALNKNQLATITDRNGNVYVENTMDVYVNIGGTKYYASNSTKSATANLFRYGYYYYDAHMYGQNFLDQAVSDTATATSNVQLNRFQYGGTVGMSTPTVSGNILSTTITNTTDPQIYTRVNALTANTATYNALEITLATTSTSHVEMRYTTNADTSYSEKHRIDFDVHADGQFHTYRIYFDESVTVKGIRLDFNGQKGETIRISAINFVQIKLGSAPALLLDRGLHTYSDKMHQALSLVATADVSNITEVGMETKIPVASVNGVRVKVLDSDELLTAISGTIENVEYAGFDIIGAGIFGYILPSDDEHCGKITITVENGNYVIRQTIVPEGNKISAQDTLYSSSELATKYPDFEPTSTDIYYSPTQFYFGQRIYTDSNHTFDAFLEEAYIERHPLGSTNITVNTDKTPNATFDGYDGIRGMYAFTIPDNVTFHEGYFSAQNFHGAVSFKVKGDEYNRNIYAMAYTYGCTIEGGAVLDRNDNMIPIPVEVSKNFNHEFEVPMFLWGDVGYSESRIAIYVNAGETEELTMIQAYMNWGQYPLKQISSIQFFSPYYHLSTGVTESNCIANYYVHGKDLQTLPDHRAASAPWWFEANPDSDGDGYPEGDPQHDNAGLHYWLKYTDSSGNIVASESIDSVINSSGPTYADIDMTYRTDDGKIEVTYSHMEMPQTDENRAYYEIKYRVLEDVTINDFANKFSFYSVAGYGNGYQRFGYWGTDGAVNGLSADTTATYTLGTNCPYFDLYQIDNVDNKGNQNSQNANVSFIISDYTLPSSLSGSSFIVNVVNRHASLSLNAGNVTLKAGEEIVINAIIMPWGYYNTADDTLVQNVRENTLVAPIVATPGENADAVDSKFLPTVKTTNGLDATVTIRHENADKVALDSNDNINVTFRVDGFKVLTAPKLYEFVNDEWQLVDTSSENFVDKTGNAHRYDGYAVHYDKATDSYSYTFVTTITGEEERSFKVVVDDTYAGWTETHGDLYFGPEILNKYGNGLGLTSELKDGYVTYTSSSNDPSTKTFKMTGGSAAKYIVLKYRLPEKVAADSGMQFYLSTKANRSFNDAGDQFALEHSVMKTTGTWQVMVIDLDAIVKSKNVYEMVPTSAGTYSIKTFRLDPFTNDATTTIDIAYIAFCRDLNEAVDMNADMNINDISYVGSTNSSGPIADKINTQDNYANMNVVFVGNTLAGAMSTDNDKGLTNVAVNGDGTVTVTYGADDNDEYFTLDMGGVETGKYAVMKYRVASGITAGNTFYALTYDSTDTENHNGHVPAYGLRADGQWHTLVIDLTKLGTDGNGITAAADGKYYVTHFRADLFDALNSNGTVDFEYIGFCDEISDIPTNISTTIDFSLASMKHVDNLYVDGVDEKAAISVTGAEIEFVGWTGVAGKEATDMAYVVTDAVGNETVTRLTLTDSSANSPANRYFVRDDIHNAVASLGEGTEGYVVRFRANLAAWAGQTVTLSVREYVDGVAHVDTYSVKVTVPESSVPGWISGSEIDGKVDETFFDHTLNPDGSVTITGSRVDGDDYVVLTEFVGSVTPKYAAIKYKTGNSESITVLATTTSGTIGQGFGVYSLKADSEWHTLLIDLTKMTGYTYGEDVSYFRIDICERVGANESLTIDHIYLIEDLVDLGAELVDAKFSNNVDFIYVDGNNVTNYKGQSSITATTVDYTGWVGVDGSSAAGIAYVVTDSKGNETVVNLRNATSGDNIYYQGSEAIQNAVHGTGWSPNTVGYVVDFVADLSAWEGQTVTLSVRETLPGGPYVNTFSITVRVPSESFVEQDTLDVIFEGQDLVDMMTDNAGNHGDLGVTGAVLNSDGTVTVKYNDSGDRYFSFELDGTIPTGKYLVVKYRTGLGVNVAGNASVNCLASTADDRAWTGHSKLTTVVADHKWHTLVIDLSDLASVTDSTGSYYITLLRADFFDALTANGSVDFAYVGLCDDLGDVALGDNEYLEYGWQNWTASLDSITVDGESAAHDSAANTHLQGSAGASDRYNSYTGGNWAWSGWFSVDGQNVTDISVCVTDEAGVEHWTSFGTPAGRSDLNKEGSMHAETNLGYATGTLCYRAAVSADLGVYAGQTVSVSVRAITESGSAVTLYSVFVTVPKSAAPHWVSGAELLTGLNTSGFTGTVNSDGSLTINCTAGTDGTITLTSIMGSTTPKYAVIRYRNTDNSQLIIYATTSGKSHKENYVKLNTDGAWHVVVVDLEAVGSYTAGDAINLMRFDIMDSGDGSHVGKSVTFDYVWFTNDLSEVEYEAYDKFDVSFVGQGLIDMVTTGGWDHGIAGAVLNADGTVTITSDSSGDSYFGHTFNGSVATGQYVVVKYRSALGTNVRGGVFRGLAATSGNTWSTGGHTVLGYAVADHNWHVLVINLADLASVTAIDGVYYMTDFRLDIINQFAKEGSVEFAYIGFCDDLNDIILEEGEYLEYSWQNYKTSPDTINLDGVAAPGKDGADYTHKVDSCGASDRSYTYTATEWTWAGGWLAVDNQSLTNLSICITDEAGVAHWTTVPYSETAWVNGTWWIQPDITTHNINNNGYGANTIGYRVQNITANLSAYAGQTVTLSLRAITADGYAVTIYSVFITVPAN